MSLHFSRGLVMRKKVILTLAAFFVSLSLAGAAFPQSPVGENSTYRGDIREDGRVDIFDLLALLKVRPVTAVKVLVAHAHRKVIKCTVIFSRFMP